MGIASGGLGFYLFGAVWLIRMSLEGAICIGTILDDEQTPFIIVSWVLHPNSRLNDLFLGPNCRKISVEKHPFCILFRVPPSRPMFDCHGLRWAPLW